MNAPVMHTWVLPANSVGPVSYRYNTPLVLLLNVMLGFLLIHTLFCVLGGHAENVAER